MYPPTLNLSTNFPPLAIHFFRSGPPGGRHLPRNTIRLADDEGGPYGQGASYSSAGTNAYKRTSVNSDSAQSIDDVLEYLRYMAEKGDVGAQFSLARVYYDGSRTVPRNFGRALFYFGSVARQHWTREGKVVGKEGQQGGGGGGGKGLFGAAASYLGLMHMRGEGVPQSFDKAKIWFQRGVDLVPPQTPLDGGIVC
jgi:SEL1 protein